MCPYIVNFGGSRQLNIEDLPSSTNSVYRIILAAVIIVLIMMGVVAA